MKTFTKLVLIGVLIFALVGLVVSFIQSSGGPDSDGSTPPLTPGPSTPSNPGVVRITILTSDTKAEWLGKVTELFNNAGFKTSQGRLIHVEMLQESTPGGAQQGIQNGTYTPTIWSPGDISWVETANQAMKDHGKPPLVTKECPRVVYAATGFAMWRPMAEALGWPDQPIGWDQIVALAADPQGWASYGHPEWGAFKFGHAHPEYSTTGFTMLATLAYNALDQTDGLTPQLVKSDAVVQAFQNVEAHTYHYGLSTRSLLTLMASRGPSYLHAVTSSETATLKTNEVNKATMPFPFVFIFPAEGTFWMDNPFCILETNWVSPEQAEAAGLYRDFLLAPAQQDLAVTIGLRPVTAGVALHAPIALDYGTDPRVSPQSVPPLAAVSGETQATILDLFQQTKKKASLTILIDNSGSMAGAKLKNAVDGTVDFMHRLAKDDQITIYLFNDKTIKLDPSGRAGDVIEQLETRLKEFSGSSNTALYDSICEAVNYSTELKNANELAGEKRLYGVVVLTDGKDTASKNSFTSLLNSCLPKGEDVEGIKVYTIAYGADADQKVLEQIAEQTNGKFLTGGPENIQAIYLALSAEQ